MANTTRLVIFLHGVGSSGADLLPLSNLWRDALPGTVFAAPDAPFPFPYGMGHQWFSIAGVTEENRPERIVAARPEFDRVINDIVAAHGFADRLDRVVFVGFSQGTIMALDALVSGRWPVGAIVGFSGRLASPPPYAPHASTALLLVHGEADTVIDAGETAKAATALEDTGLVVEQHMLPGLGHTISAEGAQIAAEFLARQVG